MAISGNTFIAYDVLLAIVVTELYFYTCSCFLINPIVFWIAFLGPVFAIILFNVVVYVVVIFILIKHTRGSLARKKEKLNRKTTIRLIISISGVMFLFGLSWLFGALTITDSAQGLRSTFSALFTVFTSLQGFFIFLFFCIFSQEARELWKETLSCGRYKSVFLNPNIKTDSAKKRPQKNGSSSDTSNYVTKRTGQSTISTVKPSISTDNSIDFGENSSEECYQEPPAKIDLSKAANYGSIADKDEVVVETDIDAIHTSDEDKEEERNPSIPIQTADIGAIDCDTSDEDMEGDGDPNSYVHVEVCTKVDELRFAEQVFAEVKAQAEMEILDEEVHAEPEMATEEIRITLS